MRWKPDPEIASASNLSSRINSQKKKMENRQYA